MKTKIRQFLQTLTAALVVVSLGISTARAITFTSNTSIGFSDTIYDGSDITVTNCTLTVNGTHSFASLRVLNGGVVTHPFNPSGLVGDVFSITDEAHALNGTNAEALFYSNAVASTVFVTDEFGLTLYFEGVDYVLVSPMNGQVMIQRTDSSAIPDGSIVLVSYFVQNPAAPTGMNLSIAGDVLIEQGGAINVAGKGFGSGFGPGSGSQAGIPLSGAGGGHGGYGGMSSSNAPGGQVYDDVFSPTQKGSAGGNGVGGIGGSGGGSVKLMAGGVLRINGSISANGAKGINTRSGGGSGGSIWLSAQTVYGTGSISADGGVGEPIHGGGGGGGRVAVYFSTNNYAGTLSAHGGNGFIAGGAGTVYSKTNSESIGLVLVDNGGRNGTNTPLNLPSTVDLTVRGGAVGVPTSPPPRALRNLLVESNGWIWIVGVPSSSAGIPIVAANATIKFGGGILADGKGFQQGPGAGFTTNAGGSLGAIGSGGGYGGYGASVPGARGGSSYGYPLSDFGSGSGGGGRGGSGGGAIELIVTDALVLDGKISANGDASLSLNGGGGSGGSIWIMAGTLSGSGLISANGGNGNSLGGGGGGGRIAILTTTNKSYSGIVSAHGGTGSGVLAGGAGTIYTAKGGVAGLSPESVLVDNGGRLGAVTTFSSSSTFTANLTIAGGASLVWPTGSPFTIRNLLITSNAWLLVTNPVQTTPLTIISNAIIEKGGTITADGAGFPAMKGTGAGRAGTSIGNGGSGGGYGGYGAIGSGGTPGGIAYGSLSQPSDLGSGGGNGVLPNNSGGAGGGALRINMEHGLLQLDGRILANGISGSGTNGGGGSGGSIWITAGRFSGSGIVSANGGGGGAMGGGGGGGGRVSISYGTNTFLGALSAFGGSGFAVGGAGTVYLQNINQKAYAVVVDNGGQLGAGTSLGGSVPSQSDLTLTGGAILPVTGTISLNNLFIGTNSRLVFTNPTPVILTIASNAIIQAGGGLVADSGGSSVGSGLGAGRSSSTGNGGSGAGYGGSGAPGSGGTPGGPAYGSLTQTSPLTGSGGGNGILPYNAGGAGGGAVQFTANTLKLDGRISANGNSGSGTNGGGGSGGTIVISVRRLFSGSGIVSANGGNGGASGGGGGGGGRINIGYGTNTFSGTLTAFGGTGFAAGGAGTILLQSSAPSIGVSGLVIVDNGGPLGASTPLGSLPFGAGSGYDITVTRGAVLAPTASLTLGNLLITSNSWMMLTNAVTMQITVNSNATILAGGRISGDGDALVSSRDGSGGIFQTPTGVVGGGGGHGGYGSPGIPGGAGGTAFDSAIQPALRGGNGGSQIASGPSSGGAGGAAIRLSVRGRLLLDGRITADGHDGISPNSGGGAGGSILLTLGYGAISGLPPLSGVGILAGAGVISANGGRGNGAGGAGGGGRISISYVTNNFSGTVTAFGGRGTNVGGAGTIYYARLVVNQIPQMLVDNGGHAGANTLLLLSDQGGFDLLVQGSAALQIPSPTASYRNLLVASNSFLICSNVTTISATSGATVQKTGGIKADGSSSGGSGNGFSVFSSPYGYSGGGGSHGGYGGASLGGAGSGNYYDSIQSPFAAGSRGGGSPSDTIGSGGGAIRFNTPMLQLDGFITANGTAGTQNSGGGSGGSVWLTVGSLIGSGIISANGGAGGNSIGGGGGGGRIAVQYTTNNFSGSMSAFGGGGGQNGGAGTIYTKANSQPVSQVIVDNAGSLGTNTPLVNLPLTDLTVKNGAVAHPVVSSLALNKLTVGVGGWLVSGIGLPNLDLTVFSNAVVEAGGFLAVDAKGFAQGAGPGAGQSAGGNGSGAGYGTNGGATATAAGGASYGSAQQPVDPGSGGGFGSGPTYAGGSRGGGALRMSVGGKLTVDGWLSAEGTDGLQDNSGGGSGGSIWVTAKAVDGSGFIAADGGFGELFGGGGGAGGRIAIYSPSNGFSGLTSVNGGDGAFPGGNGTVYSSAALPALQIIGQTPSGIVSNNVTSVEITFSTPVNPVSFSGQDYMLTTPTWLVYGTNLSYSVLAPERYQIISGSLTEVGDYKVIVGQDITDIFGQPMSQVYTGAFTIVLPVVRGRVTDTNGQPVSGVLLDPGAGMSTTLSDTNGNYTVGFVPGSSFTVTPSLNGFMFAPGSRSYTNMTADIANEDYMVVSTIAPSLGAGGLQGSNPTMSWFGLPGVTYQIYSTTNLVDWLPFGNPIMGNNSVIQIPLPVEGGPMEFFKVQADN